MNIIEATSIDQDQWDHFIKENYPPAGAFMQSWSWGVFQKDLGRDVSRYLVKDNEKLIAIFTLLEIKLYFGLSYGYIPRGPVILKDIDSDEIISLFNEIRKWSSIKFKHLIFLRLEPPIPFSNKFRQIGFKIPSYYIQPRYNMVINLKKNEEEILASFHSSTRTNIRLAEKREVTVIIRDNITTTDYQIFKKMIDDTIDRNNGINAYPCDNYFHFLLKDLSLTAFYGYCKGKSASTHFTLFFGKTATYLYGASHTAYLGSKVDTYLHWEAMKEAKRRGCEYYDLGGVDPRRWPGLTTYKRQYKGQELEYIGNIDIPFKKIFYYIYTLIKYIKTRFGLIFNQ